MVVAATEEGRRVIEEVMPSFNRHEALVTRDLGGDEAAALAHGLRRLLRTVEDLDDGARGTRVR